MHGIYELPIWSILFEEESFGTIVFLLSILVVASPSVIFSERMQNWRQAREQKAR